MDWDLPVLKNIIQTNQPIFIDENLNEKEVKTLVNGLELVTIARNKWADFTWKINEKMVQNLFKAGIILLTKIKKWIREGSRNLG